jgi:SAM-dependent methyltransferase
LLPMSDLWRVANQASQRFGAQALDYDRFRPRYPEAVFDDIMEIANLSEGAATIEVGAGTGTATEPLVERGLAVTAIEPAAEMAAVAEAKLADRARMFIGRFEDYSAQRSVELVTSFNAWHWVEPRVALERVAELIEPNRYLALIWTEVISWGQEPFERRLAEVFGSPWEKRLEHVDGSIQPVRDDDRFDEFEVRHHPFTRSLDAETFVAVTKTYGGHRTDEQYRAIARIINSEFGGAIKKTEDAALYIARRR